MTNRRLLAKKNSDGSFSVSYPVEELLEDCFVDFYSEQSGTGFQRDETTRAKRGRDVASYLQRCARSGVKPDLFELTASARLGEADDGNGIWQFEPSCVSSVHGTLSVESLGSGQWLSIIDGGTRQLGIEMAHGRGDLAGDELIDVRVYVNLSLVQEIAKFLLINDTQKKVRTDLGLRRVQRAVDDGDLTDEELKLLQTVVPDTESWKFEACRIAAEMNVAFDSPWRGRIQMPHESTKSTTLQSFFTSLQPILADLDIKALVGEMVQKGEINTGRTEFVIKILKNFWSAVAVVNPGANEEPHSNVLWSPIGSSACHIALAAILKTILESPEPDVTQNRFEGMLAESPIADYAHWYTRKGSKKDFDYPSQKGDATLMTGAANYKRLAKDLEESWRSNMYAKPDARRILV